MVYAFDDTSKCTLENQQCELAPKRKQIKSHA